MENIKETFVINLDKSVDRLEGFRLNMSKAGIERYTRWKGTDGSEMSREERTHVSKKLCKWVGCTPGTIGCYLSHIRLYEYIIQHYNDREGWFLIFEDDARVANHFKTYLEKLFKHDIPKLQMHNTGMIIQLGRFTNLIPSYQVTSNLNKPMFINGTTCYIINLDGIKQIVNDLDYGVYYHIDMSIALFSKIPMYVARDDKLIEHSHTISLISDNSIPRVTTQLSSMFDTNATTILSSTIIYYGNGIINFNICILIYFALGFYAIYKKQYWIVFVLVVLELIFWIAQKQNKK